MGGLHIMAKVRKGKRLTKTGRWKLASTKGRKREFTGTLMGTFNFGKKRIAVLSVPKKSF